MSIDCWLFIRKKVGQQAKSQPKKLAEAAFSFWLKSQLFSCFKSHLPNSFFDCLKNNKQKAKSQKSTKKLNKMRKIKHPKSKFNKSQTTRNSNLMVIKE